MKTVDSKNQIWTECNDNVVKVGFTKSFLDGLDQCWHIVPANMSRFREKSPLMVIETNDALISILSPITANFFEWNDKAQNFPDRLTEEDVVLEMRIGAVERREVPVLEPISAGGFIGRGTTLSMSTAPTWDTPPTITGMDEFNARVAEQMRRQREVTARPTAAVPQPRRPRNI